MKLIGSAVMLSALLSGCAMLPPPPAQPAENLTKPFPFPGLFSGTTPNGQLTFLIRSNGRGASCFRNTYSGKIIVGDLRYLGDQLYTEDGMLTFDSVSSDEIKAHAMRVNVTMRRISEVPVACREYFKE